MTNIVIEPTNSGNNFIIYGSRDFKGYVKQSKLFYFYKIIGVDFSNLFQGKICTLNEDYNNNDYYLWNIDH